MLATDHTAPTWEDFDATARSHTMKPPLPDGDILAADRLTAQQEAEAQSAAGRATQARRDAGQQ